MHEFYAFLFDRKSLPLTILAFLLAGLLLFGAGLAVGSHLELGTADEPPTWSEQAQHVLPSPLLSPLTAPPPADDPQAGSTAATPRASPPAEPLPPPRQPPALPPRPSIRPATAAPSPPPPAARKVTPKPSPAAADAASSSAAGVPAVAKDRAGEDSAAESRAAEGRAADARVGEAESGLSSIFADSAPPGEGGPQYAVCIGYQDRQALADEVSALIRRQSALPENEGWELRVFQLVPDEDEKEADEKEADDEGETSPPPR